MRGSGQSMRAHKMTGGSAVKRRFPANGASASPMGLRRLALDLLLLASVGLLMAVLGPYRTIEVPTALRTIYWLLAVIGGGLAGIGADLCLGRYIHGFWLRVAMAALVATPPVTLYIYTLNAVMLNLPRRPWLLPELGWQVLVVLL